MSREGRDAIIERIKKLFNLAENNPNEHEAALAAERARQMLGAYDLCLADLKEQPEAVIEKGHEIGKSYFPKWLTMLAGIVARHFNCRALYYTGWNSRVQFIGTTTDIAIAEYVFVYLRRTIEEIAKKTPTPNGMNGKRWKESFKYGLVEGIAGNLKSMKRRSESVADEATQAKAGDLVVVKRDAVEAYIKGKYPKLRTRRDYSDVDDFAAMEGYRAGKDISINPAVNQHNRAAAIAQ